MRLEGGKWHKIPGTTHSWLYPFIRKPSITGSNAYIIRSGSYLIIIDPGANIDQTEKIRDILTQEITGTDQPVLVVAGHIHVDHLYHAVTDRKLRSLARIYLAAEDWGAQQLEAGNEYWTSSDIVEIMVPPVKVDLHLLTPEDRKGKARKISLSGYDDLILTPLIHTVMGSPFFGQSLPLFDGDQIEFWSTPGHSPDSLTIRIGNLIHIGDIPFSANPGVAGRPGWDRHHLLRSIVTIRHLILEGGVVTCCPGHGNIFSRNDTLSVLEHVETQIDKLPELKLYDREQIDISFWHGLDLIEEAMKIFPIIAGRIMALSFFLDEIGMDEEAEWISIQFDDAGIDKLLSEFTQFYQEYKEGRRIQPEVVSKIIRIFELITGKFPAEKLQGLIDLSLLNRASRLFSDLLCTIYGSIPSGERENVLLIPLLQKFIQDRTSSGVSNETLMDVVDDEVLYRQALMRRIAHNLPAKNFQYRFDISDDVSPQTCVFVDPLRLIDFFSALSDFYEGISAEEIILSMQDQGEKILFTIIPIGKNIIPDCQIPGAIQREIRYAGGMVQSLMQPGQEDMRFTLQKS